MDEVKQKIETHATRQAKRYRVYIEQVNATYVEVEAEDETEARLKGYAKWRREDAHSHVSWVNTL